jgi:hypothetical protein
MALIVHGWLPTTLTQAGTTQNALVAAHGHL